MNLASVTCCQPANRAIHASAQALVTVLGDDRAVLGPDTDAASLLGRGEVVRTGRRRSLAESELMLESGPPCDGAFARGPMTWLQSPVSSPVCRPGSSTVSTRR